MTRDMKRNVFLLEFEKLYKMPVFYILTLMCLVFNIWLFYDAESYWLDYIDADSRLLAENPEAFQEYYEYDWYNETNMDEVRELAKLEKNHGALANSLIALNYDKLQHRAETMDETESESLTFTGAHRLHDHLFAVYLKYMIIEGLFIICLTTLYSMHYETLNGTEELTLATRTGYNLFRTKLTVSALFSMLLIAVVMVITLGVYFMEIDYSQIWDAYVSSSYNTYRRVINNTYLMSYPYITWEPMTIGAYLIASMGLAAGIFGFFILFMGMISLMEKNSVAVLAVVAAGCFGLYFIGDEMQFTGLLDYAVKFNPVHLVAKCGYWFMDYSPGDTWPMYEGAVLGVWTAATLIGLHITLKNNLGRKLP